MVNALIFDFVYHPFRKRLASNLKSQPMLPSELISIWSPLLISLKSNHPLFPTLLVSTITDFLTRRIPIGDDDESVKKDVSYELCLAAWVAWCFDQWETRISDAEEETPTVTRRETVLDLVSALVIQGDEPAAERRG